MRFIKNNIFFIISIILAFCLIYIKLPYTISSVGGMININERIDGYNTSGSFNMTYVSEREASILNYIISIFNSEWDASKQEISDENDRIIGTLFNKQATSTAELVAFHLANKDIPITKTKQYIIYISDKSKTDLKIGDEIVKVDGKEFINENQIAEKINTKNIGDTITLAVIRNNKEYDKNAKIINYKGEKKLGISIIPIYEYKQKINYKSKNNEYGPSGGLMLTLAIYDYITNSNLTKGRIIAGTGAVDIDGNVIEISGVKYKIKGAVKDNADIFFVPSKNYKEAVKIKKDNNYNIDIIKVNTVNEAIEYLKK